MFLMFCAQIVGKPVTAPLPAATPAPASSERRPIPVLFMAMLHSPLRSPPTLALAMPPPPTTGPIGHVVGALNHHCRQQPRPVIQPHTIGVHLGASSSLIGGKFFSCGPSARNSKPLTPPPANDQPQAFHSRSTAALTKFQARIASYPSHVIYGSRE